jgi:glycosyltransferase involved in cell wall biosynthesis
LRILFLSHYFPPEVNAPANRTYEHCREWVRFGHDVHVVTCTPSHPTGKPFPGYKRVWYQHELIDGVQVHRIWTYLASNSGVVRRALNYLSYIPTAVWRNLRLGKVDVMISTSPQFFCAVAGLITARMKGVPWVFELRDLWPDSIAAVGALKHGLLLRMLETLELYMYRHAHRVVSVSQAFVDNLTLRGIDRAKCVYIPNGVHPDFWQTASRETLRRELDIHDNEIIVSYIGTVGMAHGIGSILECARMLQNVDSQVRFLVVGDGAELPTIRQKAANATLNNITFTGLVSRDKARDYMVASDISLVLLKKSDLFLTVLPSKLFEAMAAGNPIVMGVEGEARRILVESGGGIPITPEDSCELARVIRLLTGNKAQREELGRRGNAFVRRNFDRAVWAKRYLELLHEVAGLQY